MLLWTCTRSGLGAGGHIHPLPAVPVCPAASQRYVRGISQGWTLPCSFSSPFQHRAGAQPAAPSISSSPRAPFCPIAPPLIPFPAKLPLSLPARKTQHHAHHFTVMSPGPAGAGLAEFGKPAAFPPRHMAKSNPRAAPATPRPRA